MKAFHWIFTAILLSFTSALLLSFSFAPYNVPGLAWVCLVPLMWGALLFYRVLSAQIALAILTTFFTSLFSFYWSMEAFEKVFHSGAVYSVLLFFLLSLSSSLKNIALVMGIALMYRWHLDKGSRWSRFISMNCLFVGLLGTISEVLLPSFIPWSWGNLISSNVYLLQITELTGIYGLSFILVSANFLILQLMLTASKDKPSLIMASPSLGTMISFSLLMIFCLGYGVNRLQHFSEESNKMPTSIAAAMQTNSPLSDAKRQLELQDEVYRVLSDTLPRLTEEARLNASKPIDLVILPESTVPFASAKENEYSVNWGLYSPPFALLLKTISQRLGADVYFGELSIAPGVDMWDRPIGTPRNTFSGIKGEQLYDKFYEKNILFPLGEYVPGLKYLKQMGISDILPQHITSTQFYSGNRQPLLSYSHQIDNEYNKDKDKTNDGTQSRMNDGKFLPLICYEVLFPDYVRKFFTSNEGALPDFIVNITQDAWFGDSIAAAQHMELARVRAVETRRSLLRSANSGISVLFGPDGKAIKPLHGPTYSKLFTETLQIWQVPINGTTITLFTRYGTLWIWLLGVLLITANLMVSTKKIHFQWGERLWSHS